MIAAAVEKRVRVRGPLNLHFSQIHISQSGKISEDREVLSTAGQETGATIFNVL
jgi:hypothetical protein